MKRVALGALFVSLLVGSVAMAGQGAHARLIDRGDRHSDNRGRDDNRHGNHDRRHDNRRDDHNRRNFDGGRDHGRKDWNRGNDRKDWNRGNERHDFNRRNDRRDWNRGNDRRDWNRGNDRRDWNRGNDRRDWDRGRNWSPPRHYAPPRGRFYYGTYHRPHGYYSHRWSRGERLPSAYYARPYVVYDYGRCGLRAPPYGYHWVRVDRDVVLAAVATGVILDVVFNQFG